MNLVEALILGFVQGVTEFLPVSSSGHLVIGQALMGVDVPGVFFEVTVHVATLVSVFLVYRGRIVDLAKGCLGRRRESWSYLGLILLGSVPAGIVGVGLGDPIEALFDHPMVTAVGLLITGALLWTTRFALRRTEYEALGAGRALLIGSAQAVAITPGISRSGSTTVAGLWLGLDAQEAAAFSFLLSIPAIAGAAVLQVPELLEGAAGLSPGALLGAGVVAAVTGVAAIRIFVAMLRNRSFPVFGYYCWVAGIAFLLHLLAR